MLLASLTRGDTDDVSRRLRIAADRNVSGEKARKLADIALVANQPELSDLLLAGAGTAAGFKAARARRLWYSGDLSGAVAVLEGSNRAGRRQQARLAGEAAVYTGTGPSLSRQAFTPVPGRVLHVLTNSLPHTASGYAQRSHSVMAAQREAGWDVLAVTRLAYPVQVGKLLAQARDVVDGVEYRRLLPSRLAPTMDARLQQQAEELLRVALEFKPGILHTTTHFVNGLVVRAVAEALGIPWVYEVRGQLADTWAATHGPHARDSEKYRLFRERESSVMRDADLVVTLGHAMKANIVAAGIPGEKVLIAPNAVGGAFLEDPLDPAGARRELGLPEDGQYIGTVSSLVAYEGLDDLVTAFALLAPEYPQLRLLIVGDGVSSARPARNSSARWDCPTGQCSRGVCRGTWPLSTTRCSTSSWSRARIWPCTRAVTPLKPGRGPCQCPAGGRERPARTSGDSRRRRYRPTCPPRKIRVSLPGAISTLLSESADRTSLGHAGRAAVLAGRLGCQGQDPYHRLRWAAPSTMRR